MKKTLFYIVLILFTYNLKAQDKCYCDLVEDYTDDAKKFYPKKGEQSLQVKPGFELWIKMEIAHRRNKKERGGCRLKAGDWYVADKDGNPIRAWDCGNTIEQTPKPIFYKLETLGTEELESYDLEPTGSEDSFSDNEVVGISNISLNDADIDSFSTNDINSHQSFTCEQVKNKYPEYYKIYTYTNKPRAFNSISDVYEKKLAKRCARGDFVKEVTYFKANAGWIIPIGAAIIGGGYLLSKDRGSSSNESLDGIEEGL